MDARHILIPFHDFNRGGTERVALTLAREWLDAGRKVTILCGSRGGGMIDQADARISIVELDPPIHRSLLSRLRLGRAMARRAAALAPDAVYIPGNFHFIVAHALRRAFPKLPIVAKVSNPLLPALPGPLSKIAAFCLGAYVSPIDCIVHMAPELAATERSMIGEKPVVVIAEPNLPAGYTALPRQAPPAGTPPIVLAIGRLEPQKNMALALQAFARLRARIPARLVIFGEGYQRPALTRLAKRLGIAADVDMPGYATDLPERLTEAAALVLTSRYEGYPAVVVEALAADVPVVATDCTPALASLLSDPVSGEVVPHDAAAIALALERTLALPFSTMGRRALPVAHHDAAASALAYLDLFDQLVAATD
ncbi:MAG TPA: glycosyltransferase [Novosphingobium sp.]|nr:glycosyltransferase [Novosphingobium sp.]